MASNIRPIIVAAIKPIPRNLSRRVAVVGSVDEAVSLANKLDSDVYPFVGVGAAEAFWRTKQVAEHPGRHVCLWGEQGVGKLHLSRCFHHFAGMNKMVMWDCIDGLPSEYAPTTILRNCGALTIEDWQKLPLDGGSRIVAIGSEPSPLDGWFENIRVPPLRERLSDIPALYEVIAQEHSRRQNVPKLEAAVLQAFYDFVWPENVKQLRQVVCRGLDEAVKRIKTKTGFLRLDDFAETDRALLGGQTSRGTVAAEGLLRRIILRAVGLSGWGDTGLVAERLGISVPTLHSLLRDLQIERFRAEDGKLLKATGDERKIRRPQV